MSAIKDVGSYKLDQVPLESTLHKVVRPWNRERAIGRRVGFDDIGVYACVNYEEGEMQKALAFIASLCLPEVRYVEVPFIVLKRREMGLPDFGGTT